jgi:hypothetical protein
MCGSPKVDNSALEFQQAEAARARAEEDARKARIAEGMQQISTIFDGDGGDNLGLQPVLDQRRTAMEGFYVPQLETQYSDAKDDLKFALARSGQSNSSTAGKKSGELSQAFALNRADLDSQIQGDIAATRSRMNQQRQSLESALRSSGDATASTNNALAAATTFRQEVPALNPIGNVFAGLAQGIGAVQQGFENGRIKRLATPNPLGGGTGRIVTG